MASIVSEKEQEFNWLLIEIVNSLDTDQKEDLLRAHKGITSTALTFELELIRKECHLVLNTLVAAKKFSSDNLEHLKKILKKLGREDLIKTCTKHIEKTKKGEKKISRTPTLRKKVEKPLDDIDQQLIEAKSQICCLVGVGTRAINICEEKVKMFRNNEIEIGELQDTFRRFQKLVEKSTKTIQNGISGSSLQSNKSDSELLENHSLAPIQETEAATAVVTENEYDEIGQPGQVKPPVQAEERTYDSIDMERDNTGDSGIGSSGASRDEWLKGSKLQDTALKRREKPIPKPRTKLPPSSKGEYSPLLGVRDKPHSYTRRTRANSMDDFLAERAKEQEHI